MAEELAGTRILVVEDDFYQATATSFALEQEGCTVVGPFPGIEDAFAALAVNRPDAAVLDIKVSEGQVFPLAVQLQEMGVPFLFVTGLIAPVLPDEFRDIPFLQKPVEIDQIISILVAMTC